MSPTAQVVADQTPTQRLPCLVILSGRERGRVIPLKSGQQVLGRAKSADIALDEKGVSRRHVRFACTSGRVQVEDLGSTNGCWRNGRQVTAAELRDGDCLQLGGCRLAFRLNLPDEERLLRRLYQRATRDGLTGLHNRASLLDHLGREVQHQARYGRGLALIQIDLDHFKRINDSHGHPVGDRVLVAVGRTLMTCLRASDLAGRLGGEEFLLILPETTLAQGELIASKIRQRVSSLRFRHRRQTFSVTASLGVVASVSGQDKAPKMLAAVDRACYRAKQKGRDRVESEPGRRPLALSRSGDG